MINDEKDYLNLRIEDIKHYIKVNEREDEKDFFAYYELEICKKAQKYIELTEELGCPLEVVFKALKDGQVIFKHIFGLENPKINLKAHKIAGLSFDGKNYGLWLYDNGYGDDEFYVYIKNYGKNWWLKEDLTKEELL